MITEQFLADLKSRAKISEIVGRYTNLKRAGKAGEYCGLSPFRPDGDPSSFTVNDAKGIFHDFAHTEDSGDVIEFIKRVEKIKSFDEAVGFLSKLVGMGEPQKEPRRAQATATAAKPADKQKRPAPLGVVEKTYDYLDEDGELVHQVLRFKTTDGGKTFRQRRKPRDDDPAFEVKQGWVWNLKGVKPTLYRLPDVLEAAGVNVVIHMPEGEKDADTLVDLGLVATTNAMGVKSWTEEHAKLLTGADVVIWSDNDAPGRERAQVIAASLHGRALRVRVADILSAWKDCPAKGDVSDWRAAGATVEKVNAFVATLADWRPAPKYGLILWGDRDAPGDAYHYIVQKLIPERESILVFGESQSGKSFLTQELAISGARGVDFFGKKILKPFGSVIWAYEAGRGYRARLQATAHFHGIQDVRDLPLAVLTAPEDLWEKPDAIDRMIEATGEYAHRYFGGVPLGLVAIDTHNAATTGASEIDSEVVSTIRKRYRRIIETLGSSVLIVSHKNSEGKMRGNQQLYNNIETCIDISMKKTKVGREEHQVKDAGGRDIRTAYVKKQREGGAGWSWDFVLRQVVLPGQDLYGDQRTSCVASWPGGDGTSPETPAADRRPGTFSGYYDLKPGALEVFRAFNRAIKEKGRFADDGVKAPAGEMCVTWSDWLSAMKDVRRGEEADETKLENRCKSAMQAARAKWSGTLIGNDKGWYWRTHRKVNGVDAKPTQHYGDPPATKQYDDPYLSSGPGDSMDDFK